MKTLIAENQYYKLQVNSLTNRIYFTITGTIKKDNVPNFVSNWKKATAELNTNFTVLSDCRMMQIQGKEMEKVHQEIQTYLIKNGLLQVAEVVSMNDIANLQACHIAERSELPIKKFESIEVAESYLNKMGNSSEKTETTTFQKRNNSSSSTNNRRKSDFN